MLFRTTGHRVGAPRASVAMSVAAALMVVGGGTAMGQSSVDQVSQAEIDAAMTTPTTLTFWTWVPNIEKEVALFEAAYPAIDVKVENVGQGADHYTKLRTTLQAGTGAPDVAQMEFQYIPEFTITNGLVDLRPYGAEALKDKFVDWTWSQASGPNGEVWAYPQDTGPMGMLYRDDIFQENGITPPATWDEFAAAARAFHQANPDSVIVNIASNDPGAFMGLLWQAGARPFEVVSPTEVRINVNDEKSKQVAALWEPLIKEGAVSADPDFTDEWYRRLADGTYASWQVGAWGPVFLQGIAKDTSGSWRAADLPQWTAGANAAGNWGGSTSAVITGTQNPIAAAKFAEFINTDPASAKMFATEQFFFPATTALLADPEFIGLAPDFYGGQQVNQLFADINDNVDRTFTWPPFLGQAFTDWNETVGAAMTQKGDLSAALDTWQQRLVDFAKTQGFTVSE
jgi:multiple sugar transport system substrate-binding protein